MALIKEQLKDINIANTTIAKRLDVRDSDRLFELKLAKNTEVLGDISCGQCHNASDTALPISKISVNEAISIVRFGNEKSIQGGMPIYKSFNNGKDPFISDSGLKKRLEVLYTDELLKTTSR
ncbi:hypothetical protein [Helicobacter equorum]|uniref:hypothetical protein n=1 Tax=Helicobacter equorum TaxID=361872 RepID=UPI001315A8A8|nr:hypothetical protein [Helicobacter equorum]